MSKLNKLNFTLLILPPIIVVFLTLFWILENLKTDITKLFEYYLYGLAIFMFLTFFCYIFYLLKNKKKTLFSLIFLLSIFFVLFEIIIGLFKIDYNKFYIKKNIDPFDYFGYFGDNAAVFDSKRGYKWIEGRHRILKMIDDKIIYDNIFYANNKGCVSSVNYDFQKKSDTKRYIVFGDSFTASEYLSTTWVDLCNIKCKNSEFYNFAIDGGGLPGWHNTFFKEIIPDYEFDAVILAVFGNDFNRGMVVMHHEKPYSYTGTIDASSNLSSIDSLLPHFQKENVVLSTNGLDSLIAYRKNLNQSKYSKLNYILFKNFESLFINTFFYFKIKEFINEYIFTQNSIIINDDYFSKKYNENFILLNDIINYCLLSKKELVLLSVPEMFGLNILSYNKNEIIINKELIYLANKHSLKFIDGYSFFKDLNKNEIQNLYLKHDGHWNENGIVLFSNILCEKIKN